MKIVNRLVIGYGNVPEVLNQPTPTSRGKSGGNVTGDEVSWCHHCLDVWPEGQRRAHRGHDVQEDPVTSVPVQFEPESLAQHEWPGCASSRLCGRACQTLAVSWGTPDSAAPCCLQLRMWPGLGLATERTPPASSCRPLPSCAEACEHCSLFSG